MSAFLDAGCRWQRAFTGRVISFLVGVVLVVSGCTQGDAVSPGQLGQVRFGLAIDPSFSVSGAPVTSIRATAIESTGRRHDPVTVPAGPGDELTLDLTIDIEGPVMVTVEVELLNAAGGVEFSGRVGPFSVRPGQNTPATVQTYPGPLEYLDLTAITITGRPQVLEGDTAQLQVSGDNRPNLQALWTSLDATIAQVNESGVVTTLRPGTVQIMAAAGPVADTFTLTVTPRVARIEVSPATVTLNSIGAVASYAVRAFDPRNQEIPAPAVSWTIQPATVAAVTTTPGQFRALTNGRATVKATVQGGTLSATAELVVEQTAGRVVVTPGFASIVGIGGTFDFSARAEDANGNEMSNVTFTWSSTRANVATVNATGQATAHDSGSTVIRATAGTVSGDADLIVAIPVPVGDASISGTIQKATDGSPLAGADVLLFQGASMVGSTTTDEDGSYEFTSLSAGSYEIKASASGYSPTDRTVHLEASGHETINLVLSPVVSAGQFRIVLSWGLTPADLDSHLFVPGDPAYEVYYGNTGDLNHYPFAALDVDDTDGTGPETITISQLVSGDYLYRVHDYTNGGETSSSALSTSGARVEIYGSGGKIAEYTVPSGIGTLWTVFRIENGSIVPVNTLSNGSVDDDDSANAQRPLSGLKTQLQKKPSRVR